MNYDHELQLAIPFLNERGFIQHQKNTWLFNKDNKIYDLSAADLTQIDRIEREGLFIVNDLNQQMEDDILSFLLLEEIYDDYTFF